MSSWTDNPFPHPDDLLEALKIFSQSFDHEETVKDDAGSIDEYKQRQESMMAGWEFRAVPLDPVSPPSSLPLVIPYSTSSTELQCSKITSRARPTEWVPRACDIVAFRRTVHDQGVPHPSE